MGMTSQQLDAVNARGNILVSAAAGSGKTTVLTERVINLILNDNHPVDVDKLLIVTFTKAAAAEMSKRIADALQDVINNDKDNIRAARQKILLDSADISTIDAFCNNLVKENFAQLDIKPDYSFASTAQLAMLSETAMSITTDEYYAADDEDFFKLLDILGDDENDGRLRDAIEKIYHFTTTLPFPDKWLDDVVAKYTDFSFDRSQWISAVLGECGEIAKRSLQEMRFIYREFCDTDIIGKAMNVITESISRLERLAECIDGMDWDGALNACREYRLPKLNFPNELDTETREYVKDKNSACKDSVKNIMGYLQQSADEHVGQIKSIAPHIIKMVEIVKKYSDNLMRIKKEKNQFDFCDIEAFALKLLVEFSDGEAKPTELAESICERYENVLVDEYQDTNDLQNAIFDAVSDNGKNLFTVGDVKQCIYNFRKANPLNFLKKKNSFPLYDGESDMSKIILSGNFRSSEKICAFTNYIFEKLMVESIAGMNYTDEDKLVALGTFSPEDSSSVSIDIIETGDSEKNDNALQAEYIADYIKNAVGNDLISDRGVMRPVKYSDFLIMMRSMKEKSKSFVDVFDKAGIPVSTEVETGFFTLPEICIIVNLLKVINNPIKDVPMLASALSPLFAIDPDEVANIRLDSKRTSLYSAFEAAKDSNEKVRYMLDKIKLYRRWAASLSVSSLVGRILDDSMLIPILLATENGEMKKVNLLYFIEYAKGYEKNTFGGLSGFVNYIDTAISSKRDVPRKYTVGDSNSVRIMSIHGSKGLQAPICFLVNCSAGFMLRDCGDSVALHPVQGIGIRSFDSKKRIKYTSAPREAVSLAMKKDAISEEARLLYVAMTRAQNRLIFLSACKNACKKLSEYSNTNDFSESDIRFKTSYLDWLIGIACKNVNLSDVEIGDVKQSFGCDADFTVRVIDAESINEVVSSSDTDSVKTVIDSNEINSRILFEYPYKDILGINSKYSASGLAERENMQQYYCTKRPAFLSNGEISASAKGTLMHRFMEKCIFENAKTDIDGEISRLVDGKIFTEKEAKSLDTAKLSAFFNSNVYKIISSGDTVLREPRFIYEMSVKEIDGALNSDEKVTVQGVADCVVIKNGKITVIDYKTDRVTDEKELVERYSAQLKLYAKAMNDTYGLPVDSCIIYSFALGKGISLDLGI